MIKTYANFKKIQLNTNNLINWVFQKKSINLKSYEKKILLETIHNNIELMNETIPITKKKYEYSISKIDKNVYDTDYLNPVLLIKNYIEKHLKKFIKCALLHGSICDLHYIKGWSDLDIIIILNTDSFNLTNELMDNLYKFYELEEFLYKIDYLQHHGIQFITDLDLKMYNNIFYPHDLFVNCKSLGDDIILDINCPNNNSNMDMKINFLNIHKLFEESYKTNIFKHHSYEGKYLQGEFNDKNNMYQLKYFLSVVALLPTLWLNIAGVIIEKNKSFNICRNFISRDNWEIVDLSTKIRNEWNIYPVNNNIIPDYIIKSLGKDYLKKGYYLINEMKERLLKNNFNKIKEYCDVIQDFCEKNKNLNVYLTGTILNPGVSDLDFLVDDKPIIESNVKKLLKPVVNNGGNIIIMPLRFLNKINYFENFNVIPIDCHEKVELYKLNDEENYFFKHLEIIEWLPERLCLAEYMINNEIDKEKLLLFYKSFKRSINNILKILKEDCIKYEEKSNIIDNIIFYKKYGYELYIKYEKELMRLNLLSGDIDGEFELCSYYKDNSNKYKILKLYFYILSREETNLSLKLKNKINFKMKNIKIDPSFKNFIVKRWKILSELYDWFIERGIKRGLIKYNWLLN